MSKVIVNAVHTIVYSDDGKQVTAEAGTKDVVLSKNVADELAALGAVVVTGEVETTEPDDSQPSAREALEAEAVSLGVKFNKNLSDEKLAERIAEAKFSVDHKDPEETLD